LTGWIDRLILLTNIHINIHTYLGLLQLFNMPIITVDMYSGRTQREKDKLAEAITEDIVKILGVKKEEVIIVFNELSHGNWYASGIRL
jgi:4-oxalocrotonate tautomerase